MEGTLKKRPSLTHIAEEQEERRLFDWKISFKQKHLCVNVDLQNLPDKGVKKELQKLYLYGSAHLI